MADKFGENHAAVEAFLAEVAAMSEEDWLAVAETSALDRPAAVKAIVGQMSASVRGAVDKAALDATDGRLPEPEAWKRQRDRRRVRDMVSAAAIAVARGDTLAPEHRETLLRPFVRLGFESIGDPEG